MLKTLELGYNPIGQDGAKALAQVRLLNRTSYFPKDIVAIFSRTRALHRPMVKPSTVWRILMTRDIANLLSDAVSPLKTGTNEIDFSC